MATFSDRLRQERSELKEKIEKLRAFIWDGNDVYWKLPQTDQHLLANQLHVMRQYSEILEVRLDRPAGS